MLLSLDQIEAGLCGSLDLIRAARNTEGDTQKAILKACSMMLNEVQGGLGEDPGTPEEPEEDE